MILPKAGEVRGYKQEYIDGKKTESVVVVGLSDGDVIFVADSVYNFWIKERIARECYDAAVRRLPVAEFVELYPSVERRSSFCLDDEGASVILVEALIAALLAFMILVVAVQLICKG